MEDKDSLFSFYTAEEIKSGLTINGSEFLLNNKPFQIFSGSLHYFRIVPKSWEESIKKMKHCHLNTVCTYVPWNFHENQPGVFNFRGILDLKSFIELVQQQDMFLILRIGPYICGEIDLGGLPSWLLRDSNMKLRSNYAPYLEAVKTFFIELVTLIYDYQFSISGGPIIAVQVENEFGCCGNTQTNRADYEYMMYLKDILIELGIKELLFTCDMPSISFQRGSIPDVLMTANFQTNAEEELSILKNHQQPEKPLMIAELWSGWFDHWGEKHKEISVEVYAESLKMILSYNASFNIYVFQGGTNFGFSNGANIGFPSPETPYSSTVTSYDYGALLTESGEYTKKYFATWSLLNFSKKEYQRPDTILDIKPAYLCMANLPIRKYIPLIKMLPFASKFQCSDPVVMEELGSCYGQRFGFTLYETKFDRSGLLKFCVTRGIRIMVIVNSILVSIIEHSTGVQEVEIEHSFKDQSSILWVFVENLGRVNFTEKREILDSERRGIVGSALINEKPLKDWNVYSLDFNKKFIHDTSLLKWDDVDTSNCSLPIGLYGTVLNHDNPKDTFLYSSSWNKGIAIINGFNIGRYWKIGPQKTLFLPKQLLKKGLNEMFVFELHNRVKGLELRGSPILDETE